MTYIDRLNAFHNWLGTHWLPPNSQLLFFRLLAIFNQAGWPETIRLDNFRLMSLLDTRTERVAIEARNKLVKAGFLQHQRGRKGHPSIYSLPEDIPLEGRVSDSKNGSISESDSAPETVSHIKTKTKTVPLCPPAGETGFGEELQGAFEGWLAYKAEKRQGYQPTGLQCLVTEVRKHAGRYGEAAVAALIRECMASNWQGIAFDRLKWGAPPEEEHVWRQDPETGEWR